VQTNPLSGSGNVQGRLARYFPAATPIVQEYLREGTSLQTSVAELEAKMRQDHAGAEQSRNQGALLDAHAKDREARSEMYKSMAQQ
jgi:hypothetical protein